MTRINNLFKKTNNHHSLIIGLVVFYLLLSFQALAGDGTKKIPMLGIKGTYTGGKNMSIEEIEKRAIDDAKVNALKQAGIEENITSYQNLYKSETNNSFDEIYTSDILADIQGAVTEIEEGEPIRENTKDGMKISVTINCVVVKYDITKDIEFDAEIDGLKKFYENLAPMEFSIKPTKDCYMKIFWISDKSESSILYPVDNDNKLFTKSHWYKFPEGTKYEVDTKFPSEVIRLLFVLLKKDVLFKDVKKPIKSKDEQGNSYLPEVNYSNITNWLYSIPPSERKIITQSFTITK